MSVLSKWVKFDRGDKSTWPKKHWPVMVVGGNGGIKGDWPRAYITDMNSNGVFNTDRPHDVTHWREIPLPPVANFSKD